MKGEKLYKIFHFILDLIGLLFIVTLIVLFIWLMMEKIWSV